MNLLGAAPFVVLQVDQLLPKGTRVDVFEQIYWVFLGLGTLVGIVVIGYMLFNAWKYRDDGTRDETDEDRPTLGELPEGGGKGKKLFLSFTISAVIVISLIIWTYGMLLYVEEGATAAQDDAVEGDAADPLVIEVTGQQFSWFYEYPNGERTTTLVVPEDRQIQLRVTSDDVMHNFGVPALRVKADAINGTHTETWFVAEETGEYRAICYELCGTGHSYMTSTVRVRSQEDFQSWYASLGEDADDGAASDDGNATADGTETNETTAEDGTGDASSSVRPVGVTP
jgi:cytochrome c oxidase subunit 2